MSPRPRSLVAGLATASLALAGLVATSTTAHAVDTTSPVVISEAFGGGGNSGSVYKRDFVELYNNGASPVDLSTYSVQYNSSTSTTTTYQMTALSGTIAPKGYYLVGESTGTGGTTDLPAVDVDGSISMSGTSGKVALVSNQTALACGGDCDSAAGVVDFLGYGSANDYAGSGPTAVLSSTTSAQRIISPFTNTGDNASDFTANTAPTPKAAPDGSTGGGGGGTDCSASPLPPECTPGDTTIQDVQGDGFVSPLKGTSVSKVPGIVTAVSTLSPKGFWIQDPTPDTTRTTASSGVFVFTSKTPPAVGDAVLVSASVSDFYTLSSGESLATTASLSVTELAPTLVTTVSTGNPLPDALTITPTTVPSLYAPAPASGNVEDIATVDPTHSALEFWEAHEGMLVSISDARVVGPGKPQYGEIYVTSKPSELKTYRGGTYIPSYVGTPAGRLLVSPLDNVVPPANVGDVLSGTTTGPVDWSPFGGYDIAATSIGTRVDNHLAPTVAKPSQSNQMSVATYNVENLAPSDPDSKYAALGAGVVTNLRSPDVIAVEEIQDNSGATDDGTVAADATLTKLVNAIAAAGGPTYSTASIDPQNDQDGGQPGGNIRSVFLYNPARVGFTPQGAPTATTAVTVSRAADGAPALSTNPGRVDPTNEAWNSSRKPLAGDFTFQGKTVIVVANHFNSKGGDQSADGRFQPPNRSSEVQRTKQATVLNAFVKQVLAVDPKANVVLAGDFNDYQFSGPVKTLTGVGNGAILTDLITTLPGNLRYTYVFNGVSQVLDHIFVSKGLTDVSYDVVHLNAEFSDQVSDHDPQVVRIRPNLPTPPPAASASAAPGSQAAGQYVQVVVTHFPAKVNVALRFDGTGPAAKIVTNAKGGGSTSVFVPDAATPGSHTIVATAPDGTTATATVTVTAP